MTRSSRPPAVAGPGAAPRADLGVPGCDATALARVAASPTVSTQWLCDHLGSDSMIVLDATVLGEVGDRTSGLAEHLRSRVPSAVFADLLQEFSDPAAPHPFTRPSVEHFERATRRIGVTDDLLVVVYDSAFGQWAARLWWLFRSFGFDRVSVLDGGFTKWTLEDRPVESSASGASPAAVAPGGPHLFRAEERSGFWADKPYVQSIVDGRTDALLLSAVPEVYFAASADTAPSPRSEGASESGARTAPQPDGTSSRPIPEPGDVSPADRGTLPGRIPGSVNVPTMHLVDAETHALLRRDDLRRALEPVLSRTADPAGTGAKRSEAAAGSRAVNPWAKGVERQIVAYCGDGVSAATDALALAVLGHTAVSIYDGSLSEWFADPTCPLEGGRAA